MTAPAQFTQMTTAVDTLLSAFLDRQFFRRRNNAQQVSAHFAQTVRDEVELEALSAELVRVVQETMQPESVTLWLSQERQGGRVKG